MPIAKRVRWRVRHFRRYFEADLKLQSRQTYRLCLLLLSIFATNSAFSAEYGILIADIAKVYQGPGEQYQIVGQLERGQVVRHLQVQGDWTEVSFSKPKNLDGQQQGRGWIHSKQIAVDPVSQRQNRKEKPSQEKGNKSKQSSSSHRDLSTDLAPAFSQTGQSVSLQLEDDQLSCDAAKNERIKNCEFSIRFHLSGDDNITRAKVRCEAKFSVALNKSNTIQYSLQQEQVYRLKPDAGVFEMASALEAKDEFDIRKVEVISRDCIVTAFGRSTNK